MHVVFVEPRFPANQPQFVRGLKEAGARVSAIGEAPETALGPDLRRQLDAYEQVPTVVSEQALDDALRRIQRKQPVHRLEATVEAHILPTAHVREAHGIPGTSVRTAWLCRDKPAMKDALRAAGVSTAASTGADTADDVRRFAARVGYPLILKPRSAAGASGTVRADDAASLERAIEAAGMGRGAGVAVEEFIEGHEGFYDSISIGGTVVHEFISHYYPGVLEAMRTRWISPQIATTNRVAAPGYEEVRTMAARVNRALGIETSATHMEWFAGPKGLKFSEIGCRPPGVNTWDVYAAINDFDIYREWGMAIVHGKPSQRLSRRFAGGLIALRPDRDGQILRYDHVETLYDRLGPWILDAHFPAPGSPARPVEGGYMANAWVRLRHPDYDELRRMMDWIGETVRVRAG